MGILNVTPDSFYDGGRLMEESALLNRAEQMILEGVHLVDVGGHSTRPGADEVSETDETQRCIPAIETLRRHFPDLIIAVDTFRASVARRAVEAGAALVNDISGGSMDPAMFETVAALNVPYVLTHMRGTPKTMSQETQYEDLLHEVSSYFHKHLYALVQLGVRDVILDPGFGFAKTPAQNFKLLQHLDYLLVHERPVLVGLSRKSMIWRTLKSNPENALNGTTVLHTLALLKGAKILRAHDVKQAVECINLVHQYQL